MKPEKTRDPSVSPLSDGPTNLHLRAHHIPLRKKLTRCHLLVALQMKLVSVKQCNTMLTRRPCGSSFVLVLTTRLFASDGLGSSASASDGRCLRSKKDDVPAD